MFIKISKKIGDIRKIHLFRKKKTFPMFEFTSCLSLTVCTTNTTDPNIRTLKENLLSKYCKAKEITLHFQDYFMYCYIYCWVTHWKLLWQVGFPRLLLLLLLLLLYYYYYYHHCLKFSQTCHQVLIHTVI